MSFKNKPSEIPWISGKTPFPEIDTALASPNGLLAVGGDLSQSRLLEAYGKGIFPWYVDQEPVLWWCPNPRMVIFPKKLKVSRSLNKIWRQKRFTISMDKAFPMVLENCRLPRKGVSDTWITEDMANAYKMLHADGYAHSIEIWESEDLVGGLYGVSIGRAFFGESMFSKQANASKIAMIALAKQLINWNFEVIDCQISSEHLKTMGGIEISRQKFALLLARLVNYPSKLGMWKYEERLE